MAPSPNGSILL
jgi:hypothetical protein